MNRVGCAGVAIELNTAVLSQSFQLPYSAELYSLGKTI